MKFEEANAEYLHSWYLFILSFSGVMFLFFSNSFAFNLLVIAVLFFFYYKNGVKRRELANILAVGFIFSFLFFLLNVIYANKKYQSGLVVWIGPFHFYKNVLDNGSVVFFHLFFLTSLSMASARSINYTKVILYLSVKKKIKVLFAYPLLLAMNSIMLFKDEFFRIRISAKIRNLKFQRSFFILFPLLVFAIRHSQRGALSLVSRGINEKKSFYFSYGLSKKDHILFYFILFGLAAIFFMTNYILEGGVIPSK